MEKISWLVFCGLLIVKFSKEPTFHTSEDNQFYGMIPSPPLQWYDTKCIQQNLDYQNSSNCFI